MIHKGEQTIKKSGSYYHLEVVAEIVNQLEKKHKTRLICTIDDTVSLNCGLNHLGNGNYYIMVAKRYIKALDKDEHDMVSYTLKEDPNPLGVEIPEVLEAFLAQDEDGKSIFDQLTDGRKRTLIFSILRIKNFDKQVQTIQNFLITEHDKIQAKNSKW
ncbi:YdeI/OmpD-associated family protein [uncultured Kordia sp.]|uniref:YdeI/OmpD-associated family protein n=1 Tax=uncultured Kordia sp. TaxID=507699 RepID=UPI00262480E3|nr:YdeI/OmpD-associated family protein [uncultured Kordia sp.]